MKIHIKSEGHNIRLWLPTSLLKSRFGYRLLNNGVEKIANGVGKNAENDEITQSEQSKNELSETATSAKVVPFTREQHLKMYAALRHAIKTHGHFNLVEIESVDGDKVLIRV